MAVRLDEQEPSNLDKQTLLQRCIKGLPGLRGSSARVLISLRRRFICASIGFGRSSEKGLTEAEVTSSLVSCLQETEMTVDLNPDILELTFEEIHSKRLINAEKGDWKTRGRAEDLPVSTVNHPSAKHNSESSQMKPRQLPDGVYRNWLSKPASFEVIRHHRGLCELDGRTFVRGEASR